MQGRIGITASGYTIFRERNEAGGHRYWSDEVGDGVVVWDTSLVSDETLRFCLDREFARRMLVDLGLIPEDDGEKMPSSVQPGAIVDEVQSRLLDPNAVHKMMLRGVIALPSVAQIRHIYGDRLKEGEQS
jgi:hypothetical protein